MLGRTAEELSRLVFTEFTHPEDRDADMGLYRQLLTGERDSYQIEKRYYRKDGECVWAGLAVTLIRDPGGQPKFALSIVEDITDRKRAERASLRSERQLRALSARLETLREEERARISREIHDELGQLLTGLKMDLRWIEHQLDAFGHDRRVNPILDKLVAAAELADATIKTVQRIAEELARASFSTNWGCRSLCNTRLAGSSPHRHPLPPGDARRCAAPCGLTPRPPFFASSRKP